MSCCKRKKLVSSIGQLTKEVRLFRKMMFPPNRPVSIGTTRAISEIEENGMIHETYEQDLGDLPAPVGRDKDIASSVLIVEADGVESMRVDVAYDLTTRKVLAPTPWQGPKGSNAVLKLEYVDDDGLHSEALVFPFGILSDTVPPNTPTEAAFGVTRATGEVDVPDAPVV